MPILDAGISYRPNANYSAYDEGVKADIFLKVQDEVFIGKVWPNEAVFPDFFHNNTQHWWQNQLDSLYT